MSGDDPYKGTIFETVRKPGYFGYEWSKHSIGEDERVETPVGELCVYCVEPIEEGDAGLVMANGPVEHRECGFRSVAGSLAHLQKRCSCYIPGASDLDPPGMTKREAA